MEISRDADSLSQWYLLQTKPSQEHRAKHFLEQWGAGTFLPLTREKRPITGENYPLFPGYIFGHFPETHVNKANITLGVRRVVVFGSMLAVVEPAVIEVISSRLDEKGCLIQSVAKGPAPRFHRGDHVHVAQGPLKGLLAVVDGDLPGDRVQILLNTVAHYAGGWTCARKVPEMHGAAFTATVSAEDLVVIR